MAERTPWPRLVAAAVRIGVTPAAFWRLSLREWRALTAAEDPTLSRLAFETLARRFPDEPK